MTSQKRALWFSGPHGVLFLWALHPLGSLLLCSRGPGYPLPRCPLRAICAELCTRTVDTSGDLVVRGIVQKGLPHINAPLKVTCMLGIPFSLKCLLEMCVVSILVPLVCFLFSHPSTPFATPDHALGIPDPFSYHFQIQVFRLDPGAQLKQGGLSEQ